MVWRTLLGFGMGGEWASGAVLVSETWPAEHRSKAISIMQSGWALGYMLARCWPRCSSAAALGADAWRWLFAVGVAAGAVHALDPPQREGAGGVEPRGRRQTQRRQARSRCCSVRADPAGRS